MEVQAVVVVLVVLHDLVTETVGEVVWVSACDDGAGGA